MGLGEGQRLKSWQVSRLSCPRFWSFLIEHFESLKLHNLYTILHNICFPSFYIRNNSCTPLITPNMPESTNERASLTSRTLPQMTLSDGSPSSMTGPPPPMPHYLTAEGRAIKRFAVEGNAIRTSSVSRVLSSRPTADSSAPHADTNWGQ